ncbi:PREDICTED: uncharacterized protein LOC105566528 isoform X2 [Vollenhovia emeryi]|uniref:uncharacterized protein LOC105566528 isoform X2 n=1 Tax=Vollenhovia emeryi TaxID=411798 RepID=UPI0005F3777B|nr:PREDICTED: uncharacterized protein LOC105566528 isoform X2 [Vollenhovia emeryi]
MYCRPAFMKLYDRTVVEAPVLSTRPRTLVQLLALPVVLLAGSSEEFFFEYPRKALTEFLQSLKTKKAMPKTSNVQHYHVHYYPLPFPLTAWRAPDKYYLDELYGDTLASFGWSDYRYGYSPDPSLIVSPGLQHQGLLTGPDLWDDLWSDQILDTDDVQDSIDRNSRGILVQVPVNRQQLVFHLPLKKSRQRRSETVTT